MRQVPEYAIIGAGRMARHFRQYLHLLNIPYQQWSRKVDPAHTQLEAIIDRCNPIVILIQDGAIESFISTHPFLLDKTLVHFSGSLHTELAHSAHPLMTFSSELYSLDAYQKIPFVIENNRLSMNDLLPGLNNPSFKISSELKAFYHAMCVIGGNFTAILWQKFFTELETVFKIPKEAAYPYLNQVCVNLQKNLAEALTGPLVRKDEITIKANLQALENDPFQKVYQAFLGVTKL